MTSKLDVHLKAGGRLYAGGQGGVAAIDVTGDQPKVVWQEKIEGTPTRMLAAAGKLFIVTAEGRILAYGASASGKPTDHKVRPAPPAAADKWTAKAGALLEATGVREGHALVLGLDNGRLLEELVRQSSLHVIAVDGDAKKVDDLRKRLLRAGSYGTRACVLEGNPATCPFPPYMATLVVSERPGGLALAGNPSRLKTLFRALRPYGGTACVPRQSVDPTRLEGTARRLSLHGASTKQVGDLVLLTRSGPLPGAADWSHAEANAASTGASADRIRNPTEILWFNAYRGHKKKGKNVRVSGGRSVFLVEELMWATDVYTGRKLWEVELSEEEKDHQRIHHILARRGHPTPKTLPPATQLVVVEDAIYLARGSICRVFEPATGKETGQLRMPGALEKTSWENLRVHNEYLVSSSGKHVLCMNRRTGRQLWRVEASHAPLYLAVGGDKVFCAELAKSSDARIFALGLASGKQVWQQRSGNTKLRYCPTLDILVTSNGLYRGTNGEPLKRPVDTEGKRIGLILNDMSGHLLRGGRRNCWVSSPGRNCYLATATCCRSTTFDLPSRLAR